MMRVRENFSASTSLSMLFHGCCKTVYLEQTIVLGLRGLRNTAIYFTWHKIKMAMYYVCTNGNMEAPYMTCLFYLGPNDEEV